MTKGVIDPIDDATRRVQGTDRAYTAEEIARHILDNPLRVFNVTIAQVEQLARAYLDETWRTMRQDDLPPATPTTTER